MDRRGAVRANISMRSYVYALRRMLVCDLINLSATGCLICPPASSRPGIRFRIDFSIPNLNELPYCLQGILVRECAYNKRYAWGVEFVDTPPLTREKLRGVVRGYVIETLRPVAKPRVSIDGSGMYREIKTTPDTMELSDRDLEEVAAAAEAEVRRGPYGSARRTESKAKPAKVEPSSHKRIDDDSDVKRLYDEATAPPAKKKRSWWPGKG